MYDCPLRIPSRNSTPTPLRPVAQPFLAVLLGFVPPLGPLLLRSLGGRGFSPGANHPKTILPPIPFSALTHAPVISTGMNDSSRFSLRHPACPELSRRGASAM